MADILGRNKLIIFYVFALHILLLIPSALAPIFKQVFTDDILTNGVIGWLPTLILLMAGTALMSAFVTWMQKSCLLRLSNKIELSGSSGYMWALLSSPLSLFNKKDSYRLILKADASKLVSSLLTHDLLTLLFSVVSVVFYLVMMLRLDLLMSVVVVALVVLNYIMLKIQKFIIAKLNPAGSSAPNPADLVVRDQRIGSIGLENIETFKSTASETFFFQRLLGSKISIINARRNLDFTAAYMPIGSLQTVVFLNLLLLISAMRIMDRSFSIGAYLAFQAYANAFFLPLSRTLDAKTLMATFEQRLKDIFAELDNGEKAIPRDKLDGRHTGKLDGYIEVKDVSFSYDSSEVVLQNISLSVKPGQRIALLGNSGAGKTTLLKLLQGMYEPDSGEILIDGINPARMDRRLFADSIGCANQEITLFAASVRDNITMWDESLTDADIYHAAGDACIHEYIASLEGAYEYQLSENGNNMSGGQRQRLEIARALLYNPSIVLMDEATSSIDPVNRSRIEENIIKRGCAYITVTHVLDSITDYDEIIIMDKGRIVQRGTHEELLTSSAFYASVFHEEGLAMSV